MTASRTSARFEVPLLLLGLATVALAVFARARSFPFVNYDDGSYVYENPVVRQGVSSSNAIWAFTHIHSENWHPLTTMSHMLDVQLFGLNAGAHHLVNVALHTITVLLLFLVVREMTGATWRSAFVAALFAVHPLHVESVAWISERKDVLSGLFFILTLGAYTRYTRGRSAAPNYVIALVMFALGLLSKPMLVSVPVVLLLLDHWPLQRIREKANWWRLIAEKLPFVLLALGSCIATVIAQRGATGGVAQLPLSWRVENAVVSYVIYLRQLFWPVDLVVFYPHPENTLSPVAIAGAVIVVIGLTIGAIFCRRRCPYCFTGWFWYLAMLLPVIGLVQVGLQGHADRYTYLPHIGLYLLVAWGVVDLLPRVPRVVMATAGGVIVLALSVVSARQVDHWQSSEAMWRHALAVSPNNDVAQGGLGGVLLAKGDVAGAIVNFEAALHVRPDNVEIHRALGDAFMKEGDVKNAIAHWETAAGLEPQDVATHDKLGAALAQEGHIRRALAEWDKSLLPDENDGNARNNLAWVLATSPDPGIRNAVKATVLAIEANEFAGGNNPMVLRTLAAAHAEAGRFDVAVEIATRAAELARNQGNAALASDLDHARTLYEAHTPWRDLSLVERGDR